MGIYLRARETVQRYRIRCAKRYNTGLILGKIVRGIGKACQLMGRAIVRERVRPVPVQRDMPHSSTHSVNCNEPILVWPVLFDPSERSSSHH